ncbi:class I SAM-dependent RNA methyltransferase [Lutimaribacter marinistellae]|uniref:Class I SAM-dependent RNA methyltransferase n=1 Tax=Lutimaribacter marinistellae TaxID=1820329 RepID=A0ABV7TD13_9RHOB
MVSSSTHEIFLAATPGLERPLMQEAVERGFSGATVVPGGVTVTGDWTEVWRANLLLRGANRVLLRFAQFPAVHLAQLDKRSRKLPWADLLKPDVPVRVEATSRRSRIYHAGAARERVEKAIADTLGTRIDPEAEVKIMLRIEKDMCTFSVDTSGELLHKRGYKLSVAKAPLRETMAAMFLRECGFTGGEPVVDPMCGSGSFVIEGAEIAAGLAPGRDRSFAFEQLATFDADAWQRIRGTIETGAPQTLFFGFDRNPGAVDAARSNAEAAGIADWTRFSQATVSALKPPPGPPGLVIANPPYGLRIGDEKRLRALYGSLGKVLMERFSGWRAGIVTSSQSLARATRLPFEPAGPVVDHGGTKVRLYQTAPLK